VALRARSPLGPSSDLVDLLVVGDSQHLSDPTEPETEVLEPQDDPLPLPGALLDGFLRPLHLDRRFNPPPAFLFDDAFGFNVRVDDPRSFHSALPG
jgi:hypothetical protein